MSKVKMFVDNINRLSGTFGLVIVVPFLALVITADVFMRYFLNRPFSWGNEVTGLMMLVVFFMSLGYSWTKNVHIRVEFLYDRLGASGKLLLNMLGASAALLFYGLLFLIASKEVLYALKLNLRTVEADFPIWPFNLVIALGSFIFNINLLLSIIKSIRAFLSREIEENI